MQLLCYAQPVYIFLVTSLILVLGYMYASPSLPGAISGWFSCLLFAHQKYIVLRETLIVKLGFSFLLALVEKYLIFKSLDTSQRRQLR